MRWTIVHGLWIKAKKCQYEGVIVPTTLYGAEARGMRIAERKKVNVLGVSKFSWSVTNG